MENKLEVGNQIERRKENKLISFQDRRGPDLRRIADRYERAGQPVTAQLFRNEAYRAEQESL
jgi:hypothetical protein